MAVKNVVFKVTADTTQLTKSLDEAKKSLDSLNKSVDKTSKLFSSIGATIQSDALVKNLNAINEAVRSINQGASNAAKNVRDLNTAAKRAGDVATRVSKVRPDVKEPVAPSTRIPSPEKELTSWEKFVKVVRQARTVLTALYVGNEIAQFGKSILQAAGNYQVLNIQFTTFFKSSEQAKLILQDIQDLAVKTPFKTSELQDSARILSAYGFTAGELVPTLERLGNVVSGTNIPIQQLSLVFGQVKAAGRLMGQDLLQLVNAGFNPLQVISQRTGESMLSLRKRMEQGRISFQEINAAFITATESGGLFNNLSEKLGQTFEGRVNALVEKSEIFKRKLGENLLPTASAVVEGLIKFGVALKDVGGFIKENSGIFIALSGSVLSVLLNTQKYTLSLLKFKALRQVVNVQEAYANTLAKINAVATNAQAAATGKATLAQRAYAGATSVATAAMNGLRAAFAANPIGLIITALTTAIALWQSYNEEVDRAAQIKIDYPDLPNFEAPQARINEAVRRVREGIEKQKEAILDVNITEEERLKRIEAFNKAFGTSIKLVKDEKNQVEALKKLRYQINLQAQDPTTKRLTAARIGATELEIEKLQEKIDKEQASFDNSKKNIEDAKKRYVDFVAATDEEAFAGLDAKKIEDAGVTLSKAVMTPFKNIPEGLKGLEFTKYGENVIEAEVRVKEFQIVQDNLRQGLDNLTTSYDANGNAVDKNKNKTKEYKDVLEELRQDLNKAIDEFEKQKEIALKIKIDLFKGEDEATKLLKEGLKFDADRKEIQDAYSQELANIQEDRREALSKLVEQYQEGIIDKDKLIQESGKAENLFLSSKDLLDKNLILSLENRTTQYEMAVADITNQFDRQIEEAGRARNLEEIDKNIKNYTTTISQIKEANTKLFDALGGTVTRKQFGKISENIKLNAEQEKDLTKQIYLENINRLNIEEDTEGQRLALAGATREEIENNEIAYNNKRAELARALGIDLTAINDETNKALVDADKERQLRQIQLWADLFTEVFKLASQLFELQVQQTNLSIQNQQKRVDRAKEIAEKGNAEILQLEEERLDKLVKQRQKYVAAQQALSVAELIANSVIAISKAATGPPGSAPFLIAATLASLLAGIAAARSQVVAAGLYDTGGYTGDGGRKQPAGIVHKGEFVFTQEKTRKYRTLFEEIHKGRDPFIAKGMGEKVVVINNNNMEKRLVGIEKAIREQNRMALSIDERGIHGIVSQLEWKNSRVRNKTR